MTLELSDAATGLDPDGRPADVAPLREQARRFVREHLEPLEARLDRIPDPAAAYTDPGFRAALHRAAELGLTASAISPRWGGPGWSDTAQMLMIEDLAAGAPGLSSHIMSCGLAASVIESTRVWERHEPYRRYLEGATTPERAERGAAWAATEPGVGSDIFTLDTPGVGFGTRVQEVDDGLVLDGSKSTFVSNGWCADFFVVMAGLGVSGDMSSAGVFLVPGDAPGVTRGDPMDKLGMRALNQAQVHFDQVRLPREAMVVAPGPRYERFLRRLTARGNVAVGLQAIGLAQRAHDLALAHAKQRRQGGGRLIDRQLVATMLFTAYRRIEAARALAYRAVDLMQRRRMDVLLCYAARVEASTMAVGVVEQMVQVMGGYGISKANPLERYYRDVKLMTIADGTVERIGLAAAAML